MALIDKWYMNEVTTKLLPNKSHEFTCSLIAKTIIGTAMNRTCQVTTASTPRLLYAFKLALMLNMKANGTSRSTILKSEVTCMAKYQVDNQ